MVKKNHEDCFGLKILTELKRILTLKLSINHFKACVVHYVKLAGYFNHLLIERNDLWSNVYIWVDNNNRDSPVK